MRNYTPRRAGARWLKDAPAYVLDCFDSKGPGDRYTVCFADPIAGETYANMWLGYLSMSGAPTHPQGVSMWGELRAHEMRGYRERVRRRERVRWLDLPEHIRRHVVARYEAA